jgi:type VI secretion system secreted protein VgrG
VAGQDINQLAAQNWALAAKDGIVLYTYGKASNSQKPNQETGIQLHAASGNVNSQSQSGSTHVAADKAVNISSTAAAINASSPTKIVLTAGGAGITISGGNITLAAPGNITLKAGMKNFTGGSSASASVTLEKAGVLKGCAQRQVKGLDAITEF